MKIKLSKPFDFEGKSYEEIDVNLDALTGVDLEQVEREFTALGHFAGMLETSKAYLAMVAARAAGVRVDLIKALPARDYSKVTMQVQVFLLGSD